MKALRDLRHDNIVGYITVWCEYPPSAWQKDQEESLQIPISQKVSAILFIFCLYRNNANTAVLLKIYIYEMFSRTFLWCANYYFHSEH